MSYWAYSVHMSLPPTHNANTAGPLTSRNTLKTFAAIVTWSKRLKQHNYHTIYLGYVEDCSFK